MPAKSEHEDRKAYCPCNHQAQPHEDYIPVFDREDLQIKECDGNLYETGHHNAVKKDCPLVLS